MTSRGRLLLALAAALHFALPASAAAPPSDTAAAVADDVDRLLAKHWREHNVRHAAPGDDLALLRRATLDLAGRVPTPAELDAFAADRSSERYTAAVRRLMRGPEFSTHFATVLDDLIQSRAAGNSAFVAYLAGSLRARKGWDVIFREVMIGPWTGDRVPARLFLERRARDLDVLTVDVTRVFLGVDVSCARCHNHPLVKDWKREHYHGMSAFFVRTTGGKGTVGEKADGEARFAGRDGKERLVPMTFLTGKKLLDPPRSPDARAPRFSRREALVKEALEERRFFSRAIVNRVWEYYFGRGMVHPPDQMHSKNPASVPALLDRLAEDFADRGYDLPRLVEGIARSKAYRLDSRWSEGEPPAAEHFAVARLRPLSPRQFSRSLVVALGDGSFVPGRSADLDRQAAELVPELDPRTTDFQSSTREALFVSNAKAVRKLVADDGHLAARLAALRDDREAIRKAYRAILSRSPDEDESRDAARWLSRQKDRRAACEDLVWALASSAEVRFSH